MSESPVRPNSLAEAHGKIRIFGGDGEGEQDPTLGEGADPNGAGQETPEQVAIREAQEAVAEATQKAKDAEKRAADAEKQLTDKEREGMEDAERTAAERDDYKTKYEKILKFVETSYIDHGILSMSSAKNKDGNSKYDWYDVEAVRAFIDMDAIKLDLDTGEIDGLDKQLAKIAKERPYLLVQPKEDGGQPFTPPPGPSTGNHPSGGSSRQRVSDDKALARKFKFDHLVVGGSPR